MPELVFDIEDGSEIRAPLADRAVIGSAEGNDVVAEREDIAPQHAELFLQNGVWWVRDLGSVAGTTVNGARVQSRQLREGDKLSFGSIHARFVADDAPAQGLLEQEEARLVRLREEAAALESGIAEKKQTLHALDDETKNKRASIEKSLIAEAALVEAARKQEEEKLSLLREEIAALELDVSKKKQNVRALEDEAKNAHAFIEQSRAVEAALAEAKKKHEEVSRQTLAIESRHGELERAMQLLAVGKQSAAEEKERVEREAAQIKTRLSETTSAVKFQETALAAAAEKLMRAEEQAAQVKTELEKASAQKNQLAQEAEALAVKRAGLEQEVTERESRSVELHVTVAELEAKQSQVTQSLAETSGRLQAAETLLAATVAKQAQVQADLESTAAERDAAKAESVKLAGEAQAHRTEIAEHISTKESLGVLIKNLHAQADQTGSRLAEMSGTEERLLAAAEELRSTRTEHDELAAKVAELAAQRETSQAAADELQTWLAGAKEYRDWFDVEMPRMQTEHETARKKLEQFQNESAQKQKELSGEIQRLQGTATAEESRLKDALQKISRAEARQRELEEQNRDLAASAQRLGEVQAQLRLAEMEKKNIEARLKALEESCAEGRTRLDELTAAEKTSKERGGQLRAQESDLQKSIKQLAEGQQHERGRFEQMRELANDAEREGARRRQELEGKVAELHAEIARLESRLAHARQWSDELDDRYAKLGKLPEGSPEARQAWQEIQKRKKEITDQLPTGIQVRPQSRPTVVPRGR